MPIVASYKYTDREGNLLFTKHRIEPGRDGRKKEFRIEGLKDDTERILYNIVDVIASTDVVFCDGEKDVETLRGMDIVSCSMPNGCGSAWLASYSRDLSGKNVILMLDQDHKLEEVTNKIKDGLAGYAKRIQIATVPKPHKDITEYIESGATKEDLDKLISFATEVDDKPKRAPRIENKQLREPAATHSEKLVLGAVLNGTSTFEDIEELAANDFYHDEHRTIFLAAKNLWEEVGVSDVKAVAQYLEDKKLIEQVSLTFLLDLTEDMPQVYNLDAHIDAIRSKAGSRVLLSNLENAANQLILGEDCERVQESLIQNAGRLKVGNSISLTHSASDLITDLDEILKPKPQGITCDPVQVVFDSFFGLHPGVLLTIGARSGHGKTSLMNQIIAYGCVKYKNPTDLLTFEIPKQDALVKIIAQTAKVPYLNILRGNTTEEQDQAVRKMAGIFSKAPLRIDDKNSWSIPKLRSYLKTRRTNGDPLRMLALDYLQIMNMQGGAQGDRRDLAIGKITSGLKGLAIEFGLSIVLLSQLNRAMDRDGSANPSIGNLRDSSGQENDSDIVLLINQKMDEAPEDDYRSSKIIVAKNRNGAVGSFDCKFHMPTASFIC